MSARRRRAVPPPDSRRANTRRASLSSARGPALAARVQRCRDGPLDTIDGVIDRVHRPPGVLHDLRSRGFLTAPHRVRCMADREQAASVECKETGFEDHRS